MSAKKIANRLKKALLYDGKMEYALYEHELMAVLDQLKSSMKQDKDDYIFTVTENRGHVAMLLVEKSGEVYINEEGRERLKTLWPAAYETNMKNLIPAFAQELDEGELPLNGVKVTQ
ncbi:MAG: hypothetical protein GVY04_15030 [Cyanobacteria bacterium]|jgi:hypothetical protein|nr:hypothetical protein [Cyanobacteria bacterium GSL.Bin1]